MASSRGKGQSPPREGEKLWRKAFSGEMKSLSVIAVVFALFFQGCSRNVPEKKTAFIPAVVAHSPVSEKNLQPYYYGLIEEYRTIIAEDPNNLAAVIGLGNAYSESGSWREAIPQYEHALEVDPRNADVHSDMGTAFRNIGMPDRALSEYRLALVHEPGHLNARYNMGMVYAYDLHRYGLAIHVWEELLRIAPGYPHADLMRADMSTFRKSIRRGHP